MLGFMILKIMTTLVLTVLAISALWYCSKTENSIRRSYFICVRNVPCIWNNFHVGIAYVVTGDYANYPISQC